MRLTVLAACVLVSGVVLAQDTHWVANRFSNTLSRLQPWGQVVQTVPTATNLRRVVQAPDGKLWVIRFIQPQFDIYDANGVLLTTVTNPTGNPYDVAFDTAGHAWVTGGTQLHEYDANGVLQAATYCSRAAAPLGITIDVNGNKWIAHRVTPGIVSKIDAVTGAVSTFTLNVHGDDADPRLRGLPRSRHEQPHLGPRRRQRVRRRARRERRPAQRVFLDARQHLVVHPGRLERRLLHRELRSRGLDRPHDPGRSDFRDDH